MAAVPLVAGVNDPATLSSTVGNRRRFTMPEGYQHIRLYSTGAVQLERVDGADESARGSAYETCPANVEAVRRIGRGEFCLTGSSSGQTVEISVIQAEP